ncbi:YfhO family protein [Pseudotenacibaculum sp. MALMAid0570]|uniref:YfhO family protein n=1 Tax=Pseudotenacibaculum sp. MALMAid0570 TaxID=3143938 RepID=UPI0032DF3F7B
MNFKKFLPHLISLAVFVIAALLYFHPVLKGQKMSQSDITQHIGMAKEVNDFRKATGEEPYWAESAFSGMPTYQIGTYFPNDYVNKLDGFLRFLPRPADYLFLYFLGFYLLLIALKIDWKLSILGALAFGFSTYLIIIFGAGHNAKAHAIAYMPMVLAGVLWVFQKRYLIGFSVTSLAMALEIKASHPQMTYYLLFVILILGIVELIDAIKKKKIPLFVTQSATLIIAMIVAVGVNATRLMATKEYADYSTRGKTELTINPDGTPKEITNGLSRDYITQYSYGIDETFNLLVPRYMGGGTYETLGEDSYTYEFVESIAGPQQAKGFVERILTYWGDQPYVEAPAYIGAVIFFFFFLGVFLVRGKLKYWLVSATIFSIAMSWGKNFFLTDLFIDYMPLYNKFRAVSSFQVVAELCVPLLGILAIKEFFFSKVDNSQKIEALKKALYVTGGLVIVGLLYALGFSTFEGIRDANYAQYEGLIDAVIADRKSLLYSDSFRTIVLIGISFGLCWLYIKKKIDYTKTIIALVALTVFDLVQVNLRYVNAEDFTLARKVDKPFVKSPADIEIEKDKTHYRVANFTTDPFQDGRTSYYHKSIGGYHAAKMGRYQDLIEFQMAKNNREVLNMLNIKYFIFPAQGGKEQVQINPEANGNAWFVDSIKTVNSADEEIIALDSLKTKTEATIDINGLKEKFDFKIKTDSIASIKITEYALNHLKYESNTTSDQFAVFSEIYYKDGWNAYIDGELESHYRVNYVLRGLKVPAGEHTIEFKFEPKVIQTGSTISLVSYFLLLLIPLGWFFIDKRKTKN